VKKTLAVALAVLFVLAFATPGLAQYMTYTQDLKADGDIQLERQAGHLCNTGGQWNQNIDGQGELTKVTSLNMVEDKITVGDQNDFVTAVDAVRNLTVTSTIQLCAPPKQEYVTTNYIYDDYLGVWFAEAGDDGVVSPWDHYNDTWLGEFDETPEQFFSGNRVPAFGRAAGLFLAPGFEAGGWTTFAGGAFLGVVANESLTQAFNDRLDLDELGTDDAEMIALLEMIAKEWDAEGSLANDKSLHAHYQTATAALYGMKNLDAVINDGDDPEWWEEGDEVYTWGLLDGLGYANALGEWGEDYSVVRKIDVSEQIWSVSVEADPGFSGNLHAKFEAAYGPYEDEFSGIGGGPPARPFAPDDEDIAPVHRDAWGFRVDSEGYATVVVGDDYVGNYFNIEQMARTSQGTVLRNIDISSPWSHAYFSEQSEIVGFSEVQESFAMINLGPGDEADTPWYLWFQ
jgi:hypothetical protein